MNASLLRRQLPLANPSYQRTILESDRAELGPRFDNRLAEAGLSPLKATAIEVLQVNVGKVCNQTCQHCHVDAGPDRRESMSRETMEHVVNVFRSSNIRTLDITGGAPEMNPNFRWLVEQASELNRRVIDRCNLTILMANGFQDLPEFLAAHRVEIVASLPCYLEQNCDRQRGDGVFQRSLAALRRLNELGYGKADTGLILNLVYNPVGPSLPPNQQRLESDYRRELLQRYGIEFTALHTITNLPISRFLDDLLQSERFESYMQTLLDAFNPQTVDGVMCRTTISVDWQGHLYDCDFNQMLDINVAKDSPQHIADFDLDRLVTRRIQTGRHCFGCTAGSGSSCQGALVDTESRTK